MKKITAVVLLLTWLFCAKIIAQDFDCNTDQKHHGTTEPYRLYDHEAVFDFSTPAQLQKLPVFGDDHSFIANGQLKTPIKKGAHKGLGRKFWFSEYGGEPNEAKIEFNLQLAKNFQKNGTKNEIGKLFGFAGIYDNSAGWGGKKVTDQNSWSVRIGHAKQNPAGKVPIGLYIYHPGMRGKYGTVVNADFALAPEKTYRLKLYLKLNDVGKSNGIIRFSVDGKAIYQADSWVLRNDYRVHIKSVWLDAYIGGLTPSKNSTYALFDDLKIRW
ncbi:MAG: hypothetical protein CSA60_03610 [Neptuniibacter caesariensis]|uniref:Polysaccharide lyase 14 domain-containing protein n=1 Tax=Neptuniibacter caesariensis TaxID=207954 RepID=A0A2G6JKL1_NEPCE|nr:MAG: hypothetical protein CSA60_03610 [Neptuniibacter caesariensis]